MEKTYHPQSIESRWYQTWEQKGYFSSSQNEGNQPYCIMIPPPNVTGSLHMGHAFQDTIMDGLIRFHRMKNHQTLWQAGTDHAGIATQMVVERLLNADKLTRHDLGRDKFIDKVWDWKHHSGNTITRQLRRMGASLDWQKERFTMDDKLSEAVKEVFVQLYDEGLIYRGKRLVNWDPVLHTAVSDLEVISEEESGHLWHIRYPISNSDEYVIVATTRPETMLGDTAVAIHPEDERYQHLIGKTIDLPLSDRKIPIISDDYVDPEFGTGCVKITPAHDFNDYEMGKRHQLPMINIFTIDAALNDQVSQQYQGMDRYDARQQIAKDLDALGLLEKIDEHKLMVPRGDRSGAVIEPYLTDQWYVKIAPLAKPAVDAVENGEIRFVPDNWKNTYFEWMKNIEDWCISRQIWWGHRIPAWYDEQGNIYVGKSEQLVREKYELAESIKLKQDEDVLDTWFSSALWPFSTLGWPEKTPEYETFYPTNVLVTGFDIIFFWVARMIMMGLKFTGQVPFKEVYIHGLVRDSHGQKMSKSKGNVLDPIDLIDGIELESLVKKRITGMMQPEKALGIEKITRKDFPDGIPAFGTDALRFTFAIQATTGRDINFDMKRIEGYRNFCNKLWNASRYVMLNCEKVKQDKSIENLKLSIADKWIISAFQHTIEEVSRGIEQYRFDRAAQAIYEFTWNQYCDWYVELAKPALNGEDIMAQQATRHTLINILEQLLRLAHPIIPYITEEIWQRIAPLAEIKADSIMIQSYPEPNQTLINTQAEAQIDWLQQVVIAIRKIRSSMDVSPVKSVSVLLQDYSTQDHDNLSAQQETLKTLAKVSSIELLTESDTAPESSTIMVGSMKVMIPLAGLIDVAEESKRLQAEIDQLSNYQQKLQQKLSNENFVARAPEAVVQTERDKLNDAQSKLDALHQQLKTIQAI